MSKINELINKLCPDGVKFLFLGEICEIKTGKGITKKDSVEGGSFPIISGGKEPMGMYHLTNRQANTVTISRVGANAGFVNFIDVDFYLNDKCFSAIPIEKYKNKLDSKFLYEYLKNNEQKITDMQSEGGVPTINIKKVSSVAVPVPPLEVQREIVRVLDSFLLLTDELIVKLNTELIVRKKQYEFYRDKLLTFDNDVKILPLGKVCNLQAGKAIKAAMISDTETVATPIPCYGANGCRGYVATYNQEGEKSIIGRQGALCGNVCYATGKYYATEHAVVVTDKGYFNSRYLFHVLTNADLNQYKTAGAQPGLSVSRLNEVRIAVPDKNIQDKIANVLDNFEAICTDLNIGLPAEIEARQKQYEYYRDLLLTFAEKGDMLLTDGRTDGPIRSELSAIKLLQYVFGYVVLPLSSVAKVFRGEYITKKNEKTGTIPVILGGQEPAYYIDRSNHDGEVVVIARSGASAGFVSYWNQPIFVTDGFGYEEVEGLSTTKYLYYVLKNIEMVLNSMKRGAGVPHVSSEALSNIRIPLPSLEEQKRIVEILDRFDALCNDLSAGLPAEIEARKKQYEYYRDKLLNFKEVK